MKLVTGLSMRKPNESGYNQYRRFLVANMDRVLTTKMVVDAFKQIGGDASLPCPKNVNQTALWSSRYENLAAARLQPRDPFSESLIPRNYQPEKHCEKCASIVFHSYSFDLPWVECCPIHGVELTDHCYKCKCRWPTVIELAKRKCDVCGTGVSSGLLLRRQYIESPYEYDLLSGLEEIRTIIHLNEFPAARFELLFEKRKFANKRINLVSTFSLSVLHTLELIPDRARAYLEKAKFEYQSSISVTFRLERSKENNKGVPERLPRGLLIEAETLVAKKIQVALQKGMTHELGACSRPNKSCVRCASWHLWRLCIKFHHDYKADADVYKWESYSEFIYGTRQPIVIPDPDTVSLLDVDHTAILNYKLPPYVRQAIRQQGFLTAFLNIFWYVTHFRAFIGNNDTYSRIDLNSTVPHYAHPLRACPSTYVFRAKGVEGSIYWPEIDFGNCITDLEFFYASKFNSYEQPSIQDELITHSRLN